MVHIAIMDKIKRGGSQQGPPAASSGPPRSSRSRFTILLPETFKKLTLHVKNLAEGPGTTMARSCTRGLPRHQSLVILVVAALALAGMVQHSPTVTLQTLSDPLNSTEFAAYVANTSYVTRYCGGGGGVETTNHTVRHVVDNLNTNDTEEEHPKPKTMAPSLLDFKVPMLDEDWKISALRSTFLWGALVSPLAGWLLVRRSGAKLVFAWGILIAGGSSLFVPAVWDTNAHLFLRVLQGCGTGMLWAPLHTLTATWCPREQLSLFISAYSAWSLGWGLTALIGPGLIHILNKDFIFYMQAIITCSWFACWTALVDNSPASANRDKWYVAFQPQRGTTVVTSIRNSQPSTFIPSERPAGRVPWSKLLTSCKVVACAFATLGGQWGLDTLRIAAPKYLQLVYGFAYNQVFVISALPHFGHFLSALTFGLIADHVIISKIASATTTRKLLVYTSHFMPAALVFVTAFTGCDPSAPAAMFCASVLFSGALPAGVFVSALEIAPNYAGLILAICQMFGALGGLMANYGINEGLHGPVLPGSWRLVFSAAALMLVLSASTFLVFGSSTEQPWNRATGAGDNTQQREANEDQNDENQVITEAAEIDEDGDRVEDGPTLHPSATQMTLVSCS